MNDDKNNNQVPARVEAEIITIEQPEDLISIAQKRFAVVNQVIMTALKFTNERDWVDQQGKPYLVHSGAERIARLFGISLSNIQTDKVWAEDTRGRYYIYKTTGRAVLPGRYDSIEGLGTCSQRDKFFAWKNGKLKDTDEIDETNVMKASYSNFVVNAITHLLGLRNITWEELKAAGMTKEKVARVEYQESGEKMRAAMPAGAQDRKSEIWQMCLQLVGGHADLASDLLAAKSGFNTKDEEGNPKIIPGVRDVKGLTTEKWVNFTHKKVKEEYERMFGGLDEGGSHGPD